MDDEGDGGEDPHAGDDDDAPPFFQSEGDRGVGPGDEQEDIDVINPAKHVGYFGRPVAHVVDGGISEKDEGAGHEDGAGPFRPSVGSQAYEDDSGGQGQGSRDQVDPTAHGGFGPPVDIQTDLLLVGAAGFLFDDAGLVLAFG